MKKICILMIFISKLVLGSTLDLLEYRFNETKAMSAERTMWGFCASEKESSLKSLLKETEQTFQQENKTLQDSISVLKSATNSAEISSALTLFILCPFLWPFLIILWPLFLIDALGTSIDSHNKHKNYSQDEIMKRLDKMYELHQNRSARYTNLIISITPIRK